MRQAFLVLVILTSVLATSCENSTSPVQPPETVGTLEYMEVGRLVVRVYFDDQGVPGRLIEVLELGLARTTDESGFARFVLPAGEYTVRAHGINRGGPALLYLDFPVGVQGGTVTRLKIFDCLPCV